MSNEKVARRALKEAGFRFTHSLGQNFLLNDGVIGKIVRASEVGPDDNVLEIGAGCGILTAALMERGARVLALELDTSLAPILDRVAPGARVVFGDALKVDLPALCREAFGENAALKVVSNLPYYITADLVAMLCRVPLDIGSILVMVQKEAALRMTAQPGEKEYGLLTATIAWYGRADILFDVPPGAFTPSPHVMSVLLRIVRHPSPPFAVADEGMMHKVLSAAFAMRRKTLVNNLCAAFPINREEAGQLLADCGLDPKVRGEALSLGEMARIANALRERRTL